MSDNKKITVVTLAFMAFSTVWGFGNVLNGFIYFNGIQVILSWVMMFVLYFIPYSLMVGELGSAFKNSGGGVNSWVYDTIGPKVAYYAGWTYWACHITYIASKGSGSLKALSWAVFRNAETYDTFPTIGVQMATLGVFLIGCFIASKGMNPLKKLLIFGLWGFGVVLVLRGIWVTATGKIEMDGELFLFLLGTAVLAVALFQKMRRYICAPYRNIPVLNQILSKNQLEQLLDGEHFEPIEFEDEGMKKYLEIYQSQNWMLIGGKLLSKKLALWFTMNRFRNHTSLKVLYLNGMTAKAKVDLDIRGDRYTEFTAVLKELIGYEGTLKLYEKEEQLAQKFASFFPEQTSEQDRVAAFLSQDVTAIRQDYIQTFSPPPDPRKKKRSRRERE